MLERTGLDATNRDRTAQCARQSLQLCRWLPCARAESGRRAGPSSRSRSRVLKLYLTGHIGPRSRNHHPSVAFPNGIYESLRLPRIHRARAMDAVALFIIRHVVHLTYLHPSRGAGNNGTMSAQRALQQTRSPFPVQIVGLMALNVPE